MRVVVAVLLCCHCLSLQEIHQNSHYYHFFCSKICIIPVVYNVTSLSSVKKGPLCLSFCLTKLLIIPLSLCVNAVIWYVLHVSFLCISNHFTLWWVWRHQLSFVVHRWRGCWKAACRNPSALHAAWLNKAGVHMCHWLGAVDVYLLRSCYFWRVVPTLIDTLSWKTCVRCGHCKLMVALGKWSFFSLWDLQISLGVRYREVKSQPGLYKAQLAKEWCRWHVMDEHPLCTWQHMKEDRIRTDHKDAQPIHCYRLIKPWMLKSWNIDQMQETGGKQGVQQSRVRANACAAFAVELLKGAVWCSQSAELSQADGSDWVWTSSSTGASGFCLAFHVPKLAVLPIPSPVSHAAFVHHFWIFASFPSPISTAVISIIGTKHWPFFSGIFLV